MAEKSWELISDKNLWDKSLLVNPTPNFLQSSSFGEFHEKLGDKVWRYGVVGSGKIVSFAQIIKKQSKIGSFLYVPWGPILNSEADLGNLIEVLRDCAIKEGASFIRLEPRVEFAEWQKLGLKISPTYTQPQCSLFLDLTKSLEELRQELSESTRYNIGWVERKGVRVEASKDFGDIEIFLKLLKETAARQKFTLHQNVEYYREQFQAFAQRDIAKLFITSAPAELGGEPLAAAIVIYFGDTVTYLHAASSSREQKLRAPYLMQWKIIEDAKKSGAKKYDFWGIAPTDSSNEAWAGVTAFKKSFGGEKVCYPKPYDLIISNKYYLLMFAGKIRALLRLCRR